MPVRPRKATEPALPYLQLHTTPLALALGYRPMHALWGGVLMPYPYSIRLVNCYDQGFGFFRFICVTIHRERIFRQYWKWLDAGCPPVKSRGKF